MFVLQAGIGAVSAQVPDEFTNLKVLPKDISKRELIGVMREFAIGLGVRCTQCHPGKTPGTLEGVDFASDELEDKKVSRAMMKMVSELNDRLVPAAGLESPVRVRCITCHRGVTEPESLDRLLLSVAEEKGADAAADKYRELREQYYGSGSYSFSPGSLNTVAESLAQERDDLDGAIAIMKLNVEMNPDAAFSHLMLGQFYAANGDKAAAIASIERSLELQPDNDRARKLLEQTRAGE
jgi:tetratricopeptide (TPR) repeat protein